eukprot:1723369-Pyramimonas_sp.AAC.2
MMAVRRRPGSLGWLRAAPSGGGGAPALPGGLRRAGRRSAPPRLRREHRLQARQRGARERRRQRGVVHPLVRHAGGVDLRQELVRRLVPARAALRGGQQRLQPRQRVARERRRQRGVVHPLARHAGGVDLRRQRREIFHRILTHKEILRLRLRLPLRRVRLPIPFPLPRIPEEVPHVPHRQRHRRPRRRVLSPRPVAALPPPFFPRPPHPARALLRAAPLPGGSSSSCRRDPAQSGPRAGARSGQSGRHSWQHGCWHGCRRAL